MPLLKNAIKKMRQDKQRTEHNKALRSRMRTLIKTALEVKTPESLSTAFSVLDKAAKTNLIHKGKANRLKSRLSHAFSKEVVKEAPIKEKKVAKAATTTKKKTTTKPKAKTTKKVVKAE